LSISINGLWLLESGGTCLLHRNFSGDEDINESMFSGFITAILSFSQDVVNDSIEVIKLGKREIHYRPFGKFAVVASVDKGRKNKKLSGLLERIGESFAMQYKEELKSEIVKSALMFETFGETIDQIVGVKGEESVEETFRLASVLRKVKSGELSESNAVNMIFLFYEEMPEKTKSYIKTTLKDVEKLFSKSKVLTDEEKKKFQEIVKGVSSQIRAENWLTSF